MFICKLSTQHEVDQGDLWSEEMKSDEDTESPMSTNVSVSSEASSSREASGEDKSSYWSL